MSHDDSKEDYKVHLITTLGKSEDAQAKKLLHDAAKQVQVTKVQVTPVTSIMCVQGCSVVWAECQSADQS